MLKSNGKRDSNGRAVNERKWGRGREGGREGKIKKERRKIKDKNTWEMREKVRKINEKEK